MFSCVTSFIYMEQVQELIQQTTGHILKVGRTLQLLARGAVQQAALLTGRYILYAHRHSLTLSVMIGSFLYSGHP